MPVRPAIAVSALLASAAVAQAEPTVSIRAQACPSASAIERALPERVHVADTAPLELVIEDVDGGARVQIASATGTTEVRLQGSDCAVLASAAAALADAWLVELPAPRADDTPAIAPAPEPIEPARIARHVVAAESSSARWTIAAGLGFVVDDRATARTAAAVTVAWWRWRTIGVQMRLVGTNPEQLSSDMMVTRQTWSGSLLAVARLEHGRAWLEGGAGAAVVVSQIDAAAAGNATRGEGAFAAAASGGLELWRGASLRVDAGGLAYPVRERYTLASATVARAPWAELVISGGLEIAFGGRSR